MSANANNGANAGFGYLNTNNRSSNSNANIGFRLYRGFLLWNKDMMTVRLLRPYLTGAVGTFWQLVKQYEYNRV